MRKSVVLLVFILIFSCKSVEDWTLSDPLDLETKRYARDFLDIYAKSPDVKTRTFSNNSDDLLSEGELKLKLQVEREYIYSTGLLNNAWFDFNLQLRLDPGYKRAYKSHYYFRKALEGLSYSDRKRDVLQSRTLADEASYIRLLELELLLKVSVAEIVSTNSASYDTETLYRELKSIYRSID